MAPKAPDVPLNEQSHKDLDKTAKAHDVEFSRKSLNREEKIRELRDANVPDPGAENEPSKEDSDDDVDVEGEGDRPEPEAAHEEHGTSEEGAEPITAPPGPQDPSDDRPAVDEQTPPDTLASTSLPDTPVEPGPSDRALDPDQVVADAKERIGGRTSDPSTRTEDARAADVEPDRQGLIAKPSDAGAEAYPFPPGGDVDVSLVPTQTVEGEKQAPIPVGAFVRLADHESVPKRLVGHVALVTVSPTILCNCNFAPRTHEHQAVNQPLTVQMRDETNATLQLYPEAFEAVGRQGRHELLPIG